MANPYKNGRVGFWRLIFVKPWRSFKTAFFTSLVYAMISSCVVPSFKEDAATREFLSFDQVVAGREPDALIAEPRIERLARAYNHALKTGDYGEAQSVAQVLENLCEKMCTTEVVVDIASPLGEQYVSKCSTNASCTPEISSALSHHDNLKKTGSLDSSANWQGYMQLYDKPMLRWRYRYAIFLAFAFIFFKSLETLVASAEVHRKRKMGKLYDRVENMLRYKPFGRAYRAPAVENDMSKDNLRRVAEQGLVRGKEFVEVSTLVGEFEREERSKSAGS